MENASTEILTQDPVLVGGSYCGEQKRLGECDRISSHDGAVTFQIIDIQGHPGGNVTLCRFMSNENWDAKECNQNLVVGPNDSEVRFPGTDYYLKITGKTTSAKKAFFQVCKRLK